MAMCALMLITRPDHCPSPVIPPTSKAPNSGRYPVTMAFFCDSCEKIISAPTVGGDDEFPDLRCPSCGNPAIDDLPSEEMVNWVNHLRAMAEAVPPVFSDDDLDEIIAIQLEELKVNRLVELRNEIEIKADSLEVERIKLISENLGKEPLDAGFDALVAKLERLRHFLDQVPSIISEATNIATSAIRFAMAEETLEWFEDNFSLVPQWVADQRDAESEKVRVLQNRFEPIARKFGHEFKEIIPEDWAQKIGMYG